jgi:hypothetical protein
MTDTRGKRGRRHRRSPLTRERLERIVRRVMASLPEGVSVPPPDVVDGPDDLPPELRRKLVARYPFGGVAIIPLAEFTFVWRDALDRAFGGDEDAVEEAVRALLVDRIAPGFR